MAGAVRLLQPVQDIAEDAALGPRLDALLQAMDARLDQPVGVAGPGSLDLMCALWRRGFARVEAARACTCGCADMKCELLLVAGKDAVGIMATVDATRSLLRSGGRLAIVTDALRTEAERQHLCDLLARRGFRYRPGAAAQPVIIAIKPDAEKLVSLR